MSIEDKNISVLHDRMCNMGGGEKVAKTISESLNANLYVSKYEPENTFNIDVEVKEVNPMPDKEWDKYYAVVRMLDAINFSQLEEIKDKDCVWMSGMWSQFGSHNNENNVLYCHSPNRPVYDLSDELRDRYGLRWRLVFDFWRHFWEKMDKKSVEKVNRIVCNSQNVKNRIKKYWNRDAEVLYPPVDSSNYYFEEFGDFWLSVNRIMPEKRVDLQLKIFEKNPESRLVICGSAEYGTDYQKEVSEKIDSMDNVKWRGRVSNEKLYELYARCKGTIQTAIDEDFGYIPPESFMSGKPCLAVNEGGFRESIKNRKVGFLVDKPYVDNFVKKIKKFNPSNFNPDEIQGYAQRFSKQKFVERVRDITEEVVKYA